jgi:hypothetical protein
VFQFITWWLDSSTNIHVCSDASLLSSYQVVQNSSVMKGNESHASVRGVGTVDLKLTSGYCHVYLLKTKDNALVCFKTYKVEVENQLEKKIKRFRSDRGGEYFSNEFDLLRAEHGIIHERTPSYLPQSNGVAERKNRTLTDFANSMLDIVRL